MENSEAGVSGHNADRRESTEDGIDPLSHTEPMNQCFKIVNGTGKGL